MLRPRWYNSTAGNRTYFRGGWMQEGICQTYALLTWLNTPTPMLVRFVKDWTRNSQRHERFLGNSFGFELIGHWKFPVSHVADLSPKATTLKRACLNVVLAWLITIPENSFVYALFNSINHFKLRVASHKWQLLRNIWNDSLPTGSYRG